MIAAALAIWCVVSTVFLVFSTRKYLEILDQLDEIEDLIDSSTLVLDEVQRSIEDKSKIEIFIDEPVVRELVSDMARAKSAVEDIKKSLEDILENLKEEQEEESETKDAKKD